MEQLAIVRLATVRLEERPVGGGAAGDFGGKVEGSFQDIKLMENMFDKRGMDLLFRSGTVEKNPGPNSWENKAEDIKSNQAHDSHLTFGQLQEDSSHSRSQSIPTYQIQAVSPTQVQADQPSIVPIIPSCPPIMNYPGPSFPHSVSQSQEIDVTSSAGSQGRGRKGRPPKVQVVREEVDTETPEIFVCECGDTFSTQRSLTRHQSYRCKLIASRATSPECNPKRRQTPSPLKTPRSAGLKLMKPSPVTPAKPQLEVNRDVEPPTVGGNDVRPPTGGKVVLGGEPARDDGITSGGGGTQALIGGGDVLPPTGAGDTGPPTGDGAYQPSTIYVKDQKCESFLQECKCYDHFFFVLTWLILLG